MLSVYARPGLKKILADIVTKKDWNAVDKALLDSAPEGSQFVEENTHQFLGKLLENNNGSMGLYGPEASLFDDIGSYSWYYADLDNGYCDSNKLPFISKVHGFRKALHSYFAQVIIIGDAGYKIVDLFIESLQAKVERQLAGIYELIPRSWVELVIKEFLKTRDKSHQPAKLTVTRHECRVVSADSPTPINNPPLHYEYTDYHKLFDKEYDEELINRFKKYLSEYNSGPLLLVSQQVSKFMQMDNLIQMQLTVRETIEASLYPILPFSESKKVLGYMCPVEAPVIRLISLENGKFLFAKDVDDAIRRALMNKKRKPVVPNEMLYLESSEEKKNGTFYLIPHSEYLEVLKKMQIDEKEITLVDETIARARSASVPIFSPYGTKCKSEIDVFYELLNILMIELRVWEGCAWQKLKEVGMKVEEVCKMFLDPAKPRCFVDCSRIDQLKDHLRASAEEFEISNDLRNYDAFAPYPASLSVAFLQKSLRLLEMAYRGISENAYFVNAKRGSFLAKKTISRLEFLMAIRDCIAIALIKESFLLRQYICTHKLCMQQGIIGCECFGNQKKAINKTKGESVVFEEADIDVEFENFEWTRTSFGTMKNKKTGQKLIPNFMAVTYLMTQLKNRPIPNTQHVTPIFSLEVPKTLNYSPFLITVDELKLLEKDLSEKFDSIHNWHTRLADRLKEDPYRGRPSLDIVNELLQYAYNHLENALSFEKYLPNRVFFPFYTSQEDPKTGEPAKYLQTGEFFGLLKTRIFDERSGVTAQQLETFFKLTPTWQREDRWLQADVRSVQDVLKMIGMDSDRFCVVPKLFCQFDNVPLKVSRQLQSCSKDEKTFGRAMEELKKAKMELKALAEQVAEKEKTLEQKTGALETKEKEIQRLLQQDTRKTAQLDKIQKENQKLQESVKTEKQKLTMKEEEWKKESDKTIATKNAEIQMLKQQIVERENQVKNLQNNHETATRSIRSDLSTCREEKEGLERQLAQATAKILDLEAPRAAQVDMDAQLAEAIQQNEQLIDENQILQSQLRMETMKIEEFQQQNGRLREHIQWLENPMRTRRTVQTLPAPSAPSPLPPQHSSHFASVLRTQSGSLLPPSSGSPQSSPVMPVDLPLENSLTPASPLPETPASHTEVQPTPSEPATSSNPAPMPPPAPVPRPSAPECTICLFDLTPNSRTTRCHHCRNLFHKACINQWTASNPTCPNCRGSFPNPQNFPPLGRR